MTMRRPWTPLLALVLPACLSQNPPPPAVRWFDPSSAPPAAARPGVAVRPVVTAAPFLRQEFVVRTGPRELAIDEQYRWIAPPDRIVAAALERVWHEAGSADGSATFAVHVLRFEFEVQSEVRAVVELQVDRGGSVDVVRGEAGSSSREPGDLAEAMAQALASAAQRAVAPR
jgi:uncharacterized lipoprotein YmbA